MKNLYGPWHFLAIAVVVVSLFLKQPAFVALGIVGYVAAVAVDSIRQAGLRRHQADLSGETRAIIRRLSALRSDIARVAEPQSASPEARVIGQQALAELDALTQQAQHLDGAVAQYKSSIFAKAEAEHELQLLEERIAATGTDPSLELSLSARKTEVEYHAKIIEQVNSARTRINRAIAELDAIKVRLVTDPMNAVTDADGLSDMVGRLQVLSQSYDEAEQLREIQQK